MPYLEILCCMFLKANNIKGDLARSHDIFSNDKAPRDLIPQMQALNLLENKIICPILFYMLYPGQRQWFPEGNQVKRTEAGTSFKHLGAVVSRHGSKAEVLSRIAQSTAALKKRKPFRRNSNISLRSKGETKALPCHFYYFCMHVNQGHYCRFSEKRQAFEMRCYPRLLSIFVQGPCYLTKRFAERLKQPLKTMIDDSCPLFTKTEDWNFLSLKEQKLKIYV